MDSSVFSKMNEESVVQNPTATLSPAPSWRNLGSHSVVCTEPFGHWKLVTVEQPKEEFTIYSGDFKSSEKARKLTNVPNADSVQSSNTDYQGHLELEFGQPMICAKYPVGEKCLGLFSTNGSQDRIMLPLNVSSDEGPIFVNAKQYHGILRRRKFRAKQMKNKLLKPRKPFLHLSRHLHAKRRPRGCGGRFLNTKNMNEIMTFGTSHTTKTASQNSEDEQHCDMGNFNSSPKEATSKRSLKATEVTSLYSRGSIFDDFPIHNPRPSFHELHDTMSTTWGFNLKI